MSGKLDTIRALLAKAERTENEHERDAYNAKAAELMAKYGIDHAVAAKAGRTGTEQIVTRTLQPEDPFARIKATVLCWIARPHNVESFIRTSGRAFKSVTLVGYESDVEMVEMLFTSLLLQINTGIHRRVPGEGQQAASYRRSYILGFGTKVQERMNESRTRATREAGTGTDLVLADRYAVVKAYLTREHGTMRTTKISIGQHGGYRDGREAGARADIGGARVGTTGRRAVNA
jgi:hypothetical protein